MNDTAKGTLFLSRSPLNLRKSPAMVDYFFNLKMVIHLTQPRFFHRNFMKNK